MDIEISTRTAIIVMIVISVVYSTLTVVLCFCTCCYIWKQKLKRAKDRAAVSARRPSTLEEMEMRVSTSQSWTSIADKESSEDSILTSSSTELHNRRRQNNTSRIDDHTGQTLTPLKGEQHTHRGASPELLRHIALPPVKASLSSAPILPPIGQVSSPPHQAIDQTVSSKLPPISQQTERMNSSEEKTGSARPISSEGYLVLTTHVSTLKRRKKEDQNRLSLKDCENEKYLEEIPDSLKPQSPIREEVVHKKPKVARTESTKPLVEEDEDELDLGHIADSGFKPVSPQRREARHHHKKGKVARTLSTKPLMEDEEESPESSVTAGSVRVQPEESLKEGQLVLENIDAVEQDVEEGGSLGALQEDIMEMITTL